MLEFNVEPIITSVGAQAFTIDLPHPQDLASLNYGSTKDGVSFCGPRSYQVLSANEYFGFFMTINNTLE